MSRALDDARRLMLDTAALKSFSWIEFVEEHGRPPQPSEFIALSLRFVRDVLADGGEEWGCGSPFPPKFRTPRRQRWTQCTELGRYTLPDGPSRFLSDSGCSGHVRLIDAPLIGQRRSYVVETEVEQDLASEEADTRVFCDRILHTRG